VKTPDNIDIPMIINAKKGTKRQRKQTVFYEPQTKPRTNKKNSKHVKQPVMPKIILDFDSSDLSEFEEMDDDDE
jgi:hypothetical protein